jgi:hypothetical protein
VAGCFPHGQFEAGQFQDVTFAHGAVGGGTGQANAKTGGEVFDRVGQFVRIAVANDQRASGVGFFQDGITSNVIRVAVRVEDRYGCELLPLEPQQDFIGFQSGIDHKTILVVFHVGQKAIFLESSGNDRFNGNLGYSHS